MTTEQLTIIKELRSRGLSIRDIADEVGLSKSAVDRALKNETTPIGETPDDGQAPKFANKGLVNSNSDEFGRIDLELAHEREMTKLRIQQDALSIQRQQVKIAAEQIEYERKMLAIRERQIAQDQQAEEDRIANLKEMLADRSNRLVRELLKNCEDASWSGQEVDDYIDRVKATQKKVVRLCEQQAIDEDALAIYHNLSALLKLVETTKEEGSGWFSSDVSFDFEKTRIKEVNSWLIDDFDDEYVKPVKKQRNNGDEEEEEIDSDEEDENELRGFSKEQKLVTTFNKLVAELADHSQNTIWTEDQYSHYETRIETLQEALTDYIETLDKQPDSEHQAIVVLTDELLEFVNERTAVIMENDDMLTLRLDTDNRNWLENMFIEDFYEQIEDDEPDLSVRKYNN